MAQPVKNLPVTQETGVRSLNQEDPLEGEMATHCSILAWRIPWTEELAGYSPWGRKRVGHAEELDTTEATERASLLLVAFSYFSKLMKVIRAFKKILIF